MSLKAKRPTSQQVAKRAGVSRTTVSFVLNNAPLGENISTETRARVQQAALELGYVPDAAARTLASGQTRTIGLVIPDAHHLEVDAFIPQLLYSLTEASNQRGFSVIVEGVGHSGDRDTYRALVAAKQIDGLVILNPRLTDLGTSLPKLIDADFPVVFIGEMDHLNAYQVHQKPLMAAAVQRLIDLGHERIAHITYAPITFQGALDRLNVYRHTLAQAGLVVDPSCIAHGNYSAKSGFAATQKLLARGDFTALFAGNDTIALGALAAIRQAGLRVPEDIAVIGYDDIPVAAYAAPPLSTVRTNPWDQGRRAGELLIQLIHGERPSERTVHIADARLVIRESCGAPVPRSA